MYQIDGEPVTLTEDESKRIKEITSQCVKDIKKAIKERARINTREKFKPLI